MTKTLVRTNRKYATLMDDIASGCRKNEYFLELDEMSFEQLPGEAVSLLDNISHMGLDQGEVDFGGSYGFSAVKQEKWWQIMSKHVVCMCRTYDGKGKTRFMFGFYNHGIRDKEINDNEPSGYDFFFQRCGRDQSDINRVVRHGTIQSNKDYDKKKDKPKGMVVVPMFLSALKDYVDTEIDALEH